MSKFIEELTDLINRHSKEKGSNTPDWILAQYLNACLQHFDLAVNYRARWFDAIQPTQAKTADSTDGGEG